MKASDNRSALIIIGGAAGAGKTTIARRLAADLTIPRLSSDTLGRTIKASEAFQGTSSDAYHVGYDLLWRLTEELLRDRVSVIVDTNMGWEFAWRSADAIVERIGDVIFLPVVLRCLNDVCLERIGQRHARDPVEYDPPERFTTGNSLRVRAFLDELRRPDVHVVDASRSEDEVYSDVRMYVVAHRHRGISGHPAATN